MYQNPIGPGAAAAGIGGLAWADGNVWLWAFFIALAAFTLLNAFGATLFRVLPAGVTERPRAWLVRTFGDNAPTGRRTVREYNFRKRGR